MINLLLGEQVRNSSLTMLAVMVSFMDETLSRPATNQSKLPNKKLILPNHNYLGTLTAPDNQLDVAEGDGLLEKLSDPLQRSMSDE